MAYKYNKVNKLIINRLFYIEKYKEILIIFGIIINT
jgi:hypothetical protein